MRIRTVKPEFFLHADLFDAEKETGLPLRVSFAGLWCASDREGRFKWEPRRLAVSILPYDGIDFSRVLDALTTRGFLVKYRVGDAWFGAIPSWKRHQVINNRESKSLLPDVADSQQVDACPTRDPRVTHACRKEGKGREGKGKDLSHEATRDDSSPLPASDHHLFIKAWTEQFEVAKGFAYLFDGGKDAKAVKELLGLGLPVSELVAVARQAWQHSATHPYCKAAKCAGSIHTFRHAFNDIRAEIGGAIQPTPTSRTPEEQARIDSLTQEEYEAEIAQQIKERREKRGKTPDELEEQARKEQSLAEFLKDRAARLGEVSE